MYDKTLNTPDVELILIKYEKSLPFFATVKTLQSVFSVIKEVIIFLNFTSFLVKLNE